MNKFNRFYCGDCGSYTGEICKKGFNVFEGCGLQYRDGDNNPSPSVEVRIYYEIEGRGKITEEVFQIKDTLDAVDWSIKLLEYFNSTLRRGEKPRYIKKVLVMSLPPVLYNCEEKVDESGEAEEVIFDIQKEAWKLEKNRDKEKE